MPRWRLLFKIPIDASVPPRRRPVLRIGSQASAAAPQLVALLGDPERGIRLAALSALGRIVEHSAPVQEALLGCLKDKDRRVRLASARAIAGSDLGSDRVVAGLLAALRDPEADVRAAAAGKLVCTNGKGGYCLEEGTFQQEECDGAALARSPNAFASLRAALLDPDRRVRAAAAYVLPVFKEDAPVAVPLLIDRLTDPAMVVRVGAAKSLGQLGVAARPAVPALLRALVDPGGLHVNDFNVSTKAAQAILAISPEDRERVFVHLLAALTGPRQESRNTAIETLSYFRQTDSSWLYRALADSRTALPIKRQLVKILSIEGMGGGMGGAPVPVVAEHEAVGLEHRAAIPALCQLAEDADEEVSLAAIRLLAEVDPRNHALVPSILDAVAKATLSLPQVELSLRGAPSSDVPILLERLKDANEDVRTLAAYALADLEDDQPQGAAGNLGEDKPGLDKVEEQKGERDLKDRIVDSLIPLLRDPDTQVRWAAAWCLADRPPPRGSRIRRSCGR